MDIILSKISFRFLLKFSVFSVFLGRAYQYLFWDVPFRAVLWDESLMKPIVEWFGTEWNSYVSSIKLDQGIQYVTIFFGCIYLLGAILVWRYSGKNRLKKIVLLIGAIGLVILAALLLKSQFYRLGQFFEYAIQIGIPFLLIFFNKKFITKHLALILKILIALTFVAHGLYAIGYYPVPGHFLAMVIDIFGFEEGTARSFLTVAACLDFIVAIGLFVPRITKAVLIYACAWGLLTACARIVAAFDFSFFWELLHLNFYQVVYRLPHGLIPLALLIKLRENKT